MKICIDKDNRTNYVDVLIFIVRRGLEQPNRALGFIQALHEFSLQTQSPIANRFTRLSKVWHIVNTFVVPSGRYNLGK